MVDNGSLDGSVEHIRRHYPEVVVVANAQNCGFAVANNLGIQQAKGEYVLLLNNDTWLEPTFVEKLFKELKTSGSDVIGPYEKEYHSGKVHRSQYRSTIDVLGHPVYDQKNITAPSFYLTGVCLLFPKKLYLETGGFDEGFFMYCEEVDWFWRLNLLNKKITYASKLFVYHAGSASSKRGITYQTFLWRNQNTLQMLLKNYAWYSLLWVVPLYVLQNLFESVVFLVLFKPKIALSYVQGWWFSAKNLPSIIAKRRWVQRHRKIDDGAILSRMYAGLGKLHHLVSLYGR